jgi:hypothetical protein
MSCATVSTLKIDVLRPAAYSVPPEILSVVVVDNAMAFRDKELPNNYGTVNPIKTDSLWLDSIGLVASQALADELKYKNFFDTVYFHPTSLNRDYKNPHLGELPVNLVDSLCKAYNAQGVISLELFNCIARYQKKPMSYAFSDFSELYLVYLNLKGTLYWKMYLPNGTVLDAYVQRDTIYWDSSLPAVKDAIETMAWHMGKNAVKRVAPYWDTIERHVYSGGSLLFTQAKDYQEANNWEEAAKVWYYIYENGRKKEKARAAFNLALSYEVLGNFDEAIAWSEISRNLFKASGMVKETDIYLSNKYHSDLLTRNYQKKRIEEQLGPLD